MEIDFKSILLVIIIIGVVTGTIYLGAQILNTDNSNNIILENITTNNAKNISKEENIKIIENNTGENKTETLEKIETTENEELTKENITEKSTEMSIEEKTEKFGTGLEINNKFPIISFDERYRKISESYRYLGFKKIFNYRVPFSWDMDGNNVEYGEGYFHIDVAANPTSNYGNYTYGEVTYEQFLNDYIQKDIEEDHYSKYSEYNFRELNTGGGNNLTIIEKTNSYTKDTHNILVFVSELYEYHIEICVKSNDYQTFLPVINNILSSSYLSME